MAKPSRRRAADTLAPRSGGRAGAQGISIEELLARLLYRDGLMLVIDKPAGLPVHADGVFIRHTLVHMLRRTIPGVQPVHRLDRETSGVLLLGKHPAAAKAMQTHFQRGVVAKTYMAVVRGVPAEDEVTLTGAIGPAPGSRIALRRAVVPPDAPGARPATTTVRVVRRGPGTSLVEVRPSGGRTHQIRVHLAAFGHPLLGDILYGRSDDEYLAWVRHVKAGGDPRLWPGRDAPRHMLHAARLELPGFDGEPLVVAAPLPADMRALCPEEGSASGSDAPAP